MLLATVWFDFLLEVPVFVERADSNKRYAEVAGRFAMVSREDTKAAGINAQTLVEAELGREVDERSTLIAGMVLGEPGVVERLRVRLELAQHGLVHRQKYFVLKQGFPVVRFDVDEQLDGVAIDGPQAGLDVREHASGLRVPRPPQVVREIAQAGHLLR